MSNELQKIHIDKIIIPENFPRFDKNLTASRIERINEAVKAFKKLEIPSAPIIVTQQSDHFILVKGLTRLVGEKSFGTEYVQAFVIQHNNPLLVSNIYHANIEPLTTMEKATAIAYLTAQNFSAGEIAAIYGFGAGGGRSKVSRYLRLIDLPSEVTQLIDDEQLTFGHACELLGLPNNLAIKLAELTTKQDLSVSQLRCIKKRWLDDPEIKESGNSSIKDNIIREGTEILRDMEKTITSLYGVNSSITTKPNGAFSVQIICKTPEELGTVLDGLKNGKLSANLSGTNEESQEKPLH